MPEPPKAPPPPVQPPSRESEVPRFADGLVPEAPPRPRGFLVFGALTFLVVAVVLLRALSGGTPFLLVGGIYFPAWFSAGVVGLALAAVTLVVLRSLVWTRAAGTGLVFFNFAVIYAFLAWVFLFS